MPPVTSRHFFLTRPTQFRVVYSINKWMDPNNPVDPARAQQQWELLYKTYSDMGAKLDVFEPLEGWPDSVFTGDSIFLYGKDAFASQFRHQERAGEAEPTIKRFEALGYTVHRMPAGVHFEGNGDAVLWNGRIIAGYGVRSDKPALDLISKTVGVEIIPIRVKSPHFHVDTIICPLNDETLAYVPSAMSDDSVERVKQLGAKLIEIDRGEGRLLACNSMSIDGNVILSTKSAPIFHDSLSKAGFDVLPLDLSEFAKSGGGAKCLTLEAYAEK